MNKTLLALPGKAPGTDNFGAGVSGPSEGCEVQT
jgi:hypothetical protein